MLYLAIYFGAMLAALIAARLGLTCAYLLAYAMLEPVKRILSLFLYWFPYLCRAHLRTEAVKWKDYLYEPNVNGVFSKWFLWLFLDDSAALEFGKDYADKPKYYPAFIWNTGSDFIRAYWWSAIRNSCVNWNNYCAYKLGDYRYALAHYGSDRNFYKVRQYTNGVRPYCEFWIFGRWNQVGWLNGKSPRFEIDLFKKRG